MPARVFRFILTNKVPGHTLQLVQEHLCSGIYTSNDWTPKGTIPFNGESGWQGESEGFMTGTQGWVKYRLVRDSNGDQRDLLYLYWTNPWFGITGFKVKHAGRDITADCDEDEQHGGSEFGGEDAPSPDLHWSVTGQRKNGNPTSIDELSDLNRRLLTLGTLVDIFGTVGIWERMEVDVQLTSSEERIIIPPSGPRTRTLDKNPAPSELASRWVGENVDVRITHLDGSMYHVNLVDRTLGRPLQLDAVCGFGPNGMSSVFEDYLPTLRSMHAAEIIAGSNKDLGRGIVALAAVASVLRSIGDRSEGSRIGISDTPRLPKTNMEIKKEIQNSAQEYGVPKSRILEYVAAAAAANLKDSKYTLYPGKRVALRLYQESEIGQLPSYTLHYQRLLESGQVIADTFLIPNPDLR